MKNQEIQVATAKGHLVVPGTVCGHRVAGQIRQDLAKSVHCPAAMRTISVRFARENLHSGASDICINCKSFPGKSCTDYDV